MRALSLLTVLSLSTAAFTACGSSSSSAVTQDAGPVAFDGTTPDASDAETATPDASDAARLDAGPGLNVLFIGNSYTYVNDLPGTLSLLASSSHVPPAISVSSVTLGGADLRDLWVGPDAQPAIARGSWTHVVFQEQSVTPLLDPTNFFKYAALFADAARKVGAKPTFYETWARADGDAVYAEAWSGGTPLAMQDGLLAAYRRATTDNAGLLAPAGEAWRAVRADGKTQLFLGDGSHPSVAGTYLTACVFYVKLTSNAVPSTAAVPAGVDAVSAAALRDAAFVAATAK